MAESIVQHLQTGANNVRSIRACYRRLARIKGACSCVTKKEALRLDRKTFPARVSSGVKNASAAEDFERVVKQPAGGSAPTRVARWPIANVKRRQVEKRLKISHLPYSLSFLPQRKIFKRYGYRTQSIPEKAVFAILGADERQSKGRLSGSWSAC